MNQRDYETAVIWGRTAGTYERSADMVYLSNGEYVYNTEAQVINGDDSLVTPLADELGVKRTLIGINPARIRESVTC